MFHAVVIASHEMYGHVMSSASGFSGQVVAAIRAEMGWRNLATKDLAAELRISFRAAARRLNGDVEIGLNELAAIARWLDIEISELVQLHRPPSASPRGNSLEGDQPCQLGEFPAPTHSGG